jgi:hypothetical protein
MVEIRADVTQVQADVAQVQTDRLEDRAQLEVMVQRLDAMQGRKEAKGPPVRLLPPPPPPQQPTPQLQPEPAPEPGPKQPSWNVYRGFNRDLNLHSINECIAMLDKAVSHLALDIFEVEIPGQGSCCAFFAVAVAGCNEASHTLLEGTLDLVHATKVAISMDDRIPIPVIEERVTLLGKWVDVLNNMNTNGCSQHVTRVDGGRGAEWDDPLLVAARGIYGVHFCVLRASRPALLTSWPPLPPSLPPSVPPSVPLCLLPSPPCLPALLSTPLACALQSTSSQVQSASCFQRRGRVSQRCPSHTRK